MRLLTKAAYAAPSIGFAGISLPLLIFLPTYYATQRDLPIAAVGAAFAIIRLLDIGFDPLIGAAMDRTRTRFGRFKPWVAIGTPPTSMPATSRCQRRSVAWAMSSASPMTGAGASAIGRPLSRSAA